MFCLCKDSICGKHRRFFGINPGKNPFPNEDLIFVNNTVRGFRLRRPVPLGTKTDGLPGGRGPTRGSSSSIRIPEAAGKTAAYPSGLRPMPRITARISRAPNTSSLSIRRHYPDFQRTMQQQLLFSGYDPVCRRVDSDHRPARRQVEALFLADGVEGRPVVRAEPMSGRVDDGAGPERFRFIPASQEVAGHGRPSRKQTPILSRRSASSSTIFRLMTVPIGVSTRSRISCGKSHR